MMQKFKRVDAGLATQNISPNPLLTRILKFISLFLILILILFLLYSYSYYLALEGIALIFKEVNPFLIENNLALIWSDNLTLNPDGAISLYHKTIGPESTLSTNLTPDPCENLILKPKNNFCFSLRNFSQCYANYFRMKVMSYLRVRRLI